MLLKLLRELMRVKSHSREEEAIADYIFYVLRRGERRYGVEVQHLGGGSYNVVVNPQEEPELALVAHMDTIAVDAGVFEGEGWVGGLGSADDKAGVAVLLGLALRGELMEGVSIAFLSQEESTGSGALRYIKSYRPRRALVLEPTGLRVMTAGNGMVSLEVVCYGDEKHPDVAASRGDVAVSTDLLLSALGAVKEGSKELGLRPVVVELEARSPEYLTPRTARAVVELSIPPGMEALEAFRRLSDRVHSGCVVRLLDVGEPFSLSDEAFRSALLEACRRALGNCEFGVFPGWCDANTFSDHGIPAAVFGPGEFWAIHTDEERVTEGELKAAYRFLVELQRAVLSSGKS